MQGCHVDGVLLVIIAAFLIMFMKNIWYSGTIYSSNIFI